MSSGVTPGIRARLSLLRLILPIGLAFAAAACSVGPAGATSGPSPSTAALPSNEQVTEADNGQTVTVTVGSEITLTLGNTYWTIEASSDPAVLTLESGPTTSGTAPSSCLPGMGCGEVTAAFRALAPGQATITASRTTCGEALLCTGSAGAFAVNIVVSGVSPSSSTTPFTSTDVVCDSSQFGPSPSLTCRPAIAAALAALVPSHPAITREEFRWGGLCPPGAPCVPPIGNQGIVIFSFASGPPLFVYVTATAAGIVTASSPAPYPSGY